MLLTVENISKSFNKDVVIDDYSVTIGPEEIVMLVGRSGSGKTTFLRMINNLERADRGTIRINGDPLVEDGNYVTRDNLRSYQNRIGMVFQNYELFPNLSVLDNLIEAPLAQKIDSKENLRTKATELKGLCSKAAAVIILKVDPGTYSPLKARLKRAVSGISCQATTLSGCTEGEETEAKIAPVS